MKDMVVVEGKSGLVMDVETNEGPVQLVPMRNMLPDSEFGAMYWDWD